MTCPHCAATTTTELTQKTQLGYRTFRCAACQRQFNERTGTPYNYLEFPTDIVLLYGRGQTLIRRCAGGGCAVIRTGNSL